MEYIDRRELKLLLEWCYANDRYLHMACLTAFAHGLRVSELRRLTPADVNGGCLAVVASKDGMKRLEPLALNDNPVFSEGSLAVHAHGVALAGKTHLFELSRQQFDRRLKAACQAVGIARQKAHMHALRHSTAMETFAGTTSLGSVRQALRHRSWSASMVYLNEMDASKGYSAMAASLAAMAAAG
jgi:integrase